MKTLKYETREDWLVARKGKITGSALKNVITKRGTKWKIGVYQIIADRVCIEEDEENPMDRGHRLEEEAIARFSKETGKEVDTSLVLWARDDNDSIAISPDGMIQVGEALVIASTGTREAVEAKCLSAAHHIAAWHTNDIPDDYKDQAVQYFVVNEELQTLYFVFYDPRIPSKDFFYLTITRESVQTKVEEYLKYQKDLLVSVDEIVNQLTF